MHLFAKFFGHRNKQNSKKKDVRIHDKMIFFLVLCAVTIYICQFIILPNCLSQYYPTSNEASAILWIPLVFFSVFINILFDINVGKWAIIDIVYGAMVAIYNGEGLYGIGLTGAQLDGVALVYSMEFSIIIIITTTLSLFVFQMFIRTVRKMILKAANKA